LQRPDHVGRRQRGTAGCSQRPALQGAEEDRAQPRGRELHDSSGIGELVSAYTTVKNQGGELKLLNLTKKVHDLLQITKLYTVFDVKDDEASAVKAFR